MEGDETVYGLRAFQYLYDGDTDDFDEDDFELTDDKVAAELSDHRDLDTIDHEHDLGDDDEIE